MRRFPRKHPSPTCRYLRPLHLDQLWWNYSKPAGLTVVFAGPVLGFGRGQTQHLPSHSISQRFRRAILYIQCARASSGALYVRKSCMFACSAPRSCAVSYPMRMFKHRLDLSHWWIQNVLLNSGVTFGLWVLGMLRGDAKIK